MLYGDLRDPVALLRGDVRGTAELAALLALCGRSTRRQALA